MMPLWLAKLLYWNSIMADMSEMPVAADKQKEREKKLKDRIGIFEYDRFMAKHYPNRGKPYPYIKFPEVDIPGSYSDYLDTITGVGK